MSISRSRPIIAALLTAGLVALSACAGGSSNSPDGGSGDRDQVRFMMFPGQSYRLPVLVAEDQGYFDDRGIDIDIVDQPGTISGIQGLEATDSQVGSVAVATLGQGVQAGSEAKFFCGSIDVIQATLLAPVGSKLPSTSDGTSWKKVLQSLDGKTLGITAPIGSGVQKLIAAAFAEAGVDDITYVNLGGATPAIIAAVDNGSVDAAVTFPTATQFLEVGDKAKVLAYLPDGPTAMKDNYGSAWVAPTEWLEANPELATKVCEAIAEATEFIQDPKNKKVASEILQADTQLDPEVADAVIEQGYADFSTTIPKDRLDATISTYEDLEIFAPEPALTFEQLVADLAGGAQ